MRAPRTRFAASLVVTLAAASCGRTVDHREPVHPNPPPVTDNNPQPAGQTWNVIVDSDGTCRAMAEISCPEGASCNPPPPAKIACPDGAASASYTIRETAPNECELVAPMPACAHGMSCNPPAPRKIDCPQS